MEKANLGADHLGAIDLGFGITYDLVPKSVQIFSKLNYNSVSTFSFGGGATYLSMTVLTLGLRANFVPMLIQ